MFQKWRGQGEGNTKLKMGGWSLTDFECLGPKFAGK